MFNFKKRFFNLHNFLKIFGIIYVAFIIKCIYLDNSFSERLKVHQLIEKHGYPLEIHNVITEDGYILTLHRIPSERPKSPPVFLLHGALNSAADFLVQGPENALPYKLSDAGFDVWLGNSRGSTWSRKHQFLDPDLDAGQFFNYTFHEMGIYDLPASIDYILQITKLKQLYFIGYSQGASAFFVMGSERREYLKKIKLMSALAPFVITENAESFVVQALTQTKFYILQNFVLEFLGIHELFNADGYYASYMRSVCNENSLFANLCVYQLSLFHGFNWDHFNKSLLGDIYTNLPAGCSNKQMVHLQQLIISGKFIKFDYGKELNLKIYGQEAPPEYNLERVTVPVALYYSNNDYLVNIKDIEVLKSKLPNVVKNYLVPLKEFTHNDFLYAKIANDILYDEIIKEMKRKR